MRTMSAQKIKITRAKVMAAQAGKQALGFATKRQKPENCACYAWSDLKCDLARLASERADKFPQFKTKIRPSKAEKAA